MKRLQVNGFWVFAQIKKHLDGDTGPFKVYIQKIDPLWQEFTDDEKELWRGLAKGYKNTEIFEDMKITHYKLHKAHKPSEVLKLKDHWIKHQFQLANWFLSTACSVCD